MADSRAHRRTRGREGEGASGQGRGRLLSQSAGPLNILRHLEATCSNQAINFEAILASQYAWALRSPRTIVDVGAHRGMHTSGFLAMGARHVHAFEPIPELCEHLARTFGCGRLTVHHTALGDRSGRTSFLVDQATPSWSGIQRRSDTKGDREYQSIEVDIRTLDEFRLGEVDYIKVDTEGAELLVLAGAEKTIATWRPLLSVEYGWAGYHSYGFERGSLLVWTKTHGYLVCDLFGESLAEVYEECVDRYYWDFLLVPQERTDLAERLGENGRLILAGIEQFFVL